MGDFVRQSKRQARVFIRGANQADGHHANVSGMRGLRFALVWRTSAVTDLIRTFASVVTELGPIVL